MASSLLLLLHEHMHNCIKNQFNVASMYVIPGLNIWSLEKYFESSCTGRLINTLSVIVHCLWIFVYEWGPCEISLFTQAYLLVLSLFLSRLGSHVVEVC